MVDPVLLLEQQITDLEAEIKWGRDHPWAGYCGEDDAREDRLAELKQELKEAKA